MSQIIIIGSGPAGVSASLYAVRAGINTMVITKGPGALSKAGMIENYYGYSDPIKGSDLEQQSIEGAKKLGVHFTEEEVVGVSFEDKLTVQTTNNSYTADAVIIATGSPRNIPKVPGLEDFDGKGVSYCATCDGFFYRGKKVAVLGSGDFALHETSDLLPIVSGVTVLTDGITPSVTFPPNVDVITKKILSLSGDELINSVVFTDNSVLAIDGLFVAHGVAGSTALAKKIGALTEGTRIVIDDKMATNVPGLYAAGDCTGGMLQVAKAVYEGAKAGSEAAKFILRNNKK